MKSSALRALWALVFLSSFPAPAVCAATTAFGPKTYTIERGKPQIFNETVIVDASTNCDGVAGFMLVVQNGDASERNRISSGLVTLNGTVVLRESDLNPNAGSMMIPVVLGTMNTLQVELKSGSPASSLTLSIRKSIGQVTRPATSYTLSQKQQSFSDTFPLSDTSGTFVLSVQNGTPTGSSRVTSGTVAVNGQNVVSAKDLDRSIASLTRFVTLSSSNDVRVDLKGDVGDRLLVTIKKELDENACGPKAFFQEPVVDSVISTSSILASGTVIGPRGTAVTVNGFVADVDLSRDGTAIDPFLWFAEVKALAGTVVLRATATAPNGAVGFAERHVVFAPSLDTFEFTPSSRSGVAPLPVRFHVGPLDGVEITRYEIDLNGDGVFEGSFNDLPDPLEFTYADAGQYVPAIRCTTIGGATLTATTHVSVQPFLVMDAMFRAAWTRFTTALAGTDVDAALQELSPAAQGKYGVPLRTIRADLPAYSASITGFNAVWIGETAAHYLLTRNLDGRKAGYHVYFTRGTDGVWRLSQF